MGKRSRATKIIINIIKQKQYMKTTHKEWLEIFPEAREYLNEDLNNQLTRLDNLTKEFTNQLNMVERFIQPKNKWFHELVMEHFIEQDIKDTEKRIKEINRYLYKETKGQITDEDIQRAKEYPFNSLIEFKRGFAKCPFHNEKTASLSWNKRNNTIKCFGCGYFGDTIAYVMDTQKVDFITAVKYLK